MLTPEQLKQAAEELKVLFKKIHDIELSDEEAQQQAQILLQFFADIFQLQGVVQR